MRIVVFGSAAFVTGTGLVGWYITDSALLFVALLAVRGCFGVICAPLHPTAARLVANWTHASKTDLVNDLKQQVGEPARIGRLSRFFAPRHISVMAQIALSLMLLFAAVMIVIAVQP